MTIQIRDLEDPRLVKALAHPLRIDILRILQLRVASPSEISKQLGVRLPNVSYHTRALERMGLIELVRTRPRRGAQEHFYRALGPVRINDNVWSQVPEVVTSAVADAAVARAVRAMSAAASSDGFSGRDALAARRIMTLDEQGLRELSRAGKELLARAEKIEKESARRLAKAKGEHDAVRGGLVVALFDAPPPEAVIDRSDSPRHRRPAASRRSRTRGSA